MTKFLPSRSSSGIGIVLISVFDGVAVKNKRSLSGHPRYFPSPVVSASEVIIQICNYRKYGQ